jgi:hypothetical protein
MSTDYFVCNKCGMAGDADCFYNDRTTATGKTTTCKSCHRINEVLAGRENWKQKARALEREVRKLKKSRPAQSPERAADSEVIAIAEMVNEIVESKVKFYKDKLAYIAASVGELQ